MATYAKNPQVSDQAHQDLVATFVKFDRDHSGTIDLSEVAAALRSVGLSPSAEALRGMIQAADLDHSGTIAFNEFVAIYLQAQSTSHTSPRPRGHSGALSASAASEPAGKGPDETRVLITGAHGLHMFVEEEKVAFVNHINETLAGDPLLASKLPINPQNRDIFASVRDGLLLAKLINAAVPGTICDRALNTNIATLNTFQINENQNLVINSAKAIGCSVVNIGAADMVNGTEHLVLGLIWQIIKIRLLSGVTLANHPELCRLLGENEDISALLRLSPEQVLIRWVNYHLARAGSARRITNLVNDIRDSEAYTILLTQIGRGACTSAPLQQSDPTRRAEEMLREAAKIDCNKFVTATDVVQANPHLNLAFTANLFNKYPALDPPPATIIIPTLDDDENDSRESRAFRMWINSLNVDPYINNIYEDLADGVAILQMLDKVQPGIVHWPRVNRPAPNVFKKVENTNYAVLLGRQLRFSLVNVSGKDITDKNRKLILGFVWQIMRMHVLKIIRALRSDGRDVDEQFVINAANDRVRSRGVAPISNFRDPALRNSVYLFHLLATVAPNAVNWDLVATGSTDEECAANAKMCISVARKCDCCVFLLWEDIVELKPKMLMVMIATILAVAQRPT
eukprot:gnl/Spiro4/27185_TR13521_c0_g1_i2.p1 gnl/Spiro4/27185_TR13521_c0_g1~~gnl/Spiro4/27185_TR13521_c0_g1_i2.p1  ORF type:complete len:640 (+),score=193.86 gnl/Spiro4/27185_TR13521_c0_g1_i2:37-1920(+)